MNFGPTNRRFLMADERECVAAFPWRKRQRRSRLPSPGASASGVLICLPLAQAPAAITSVSDSTGAILAINRYDEYGLPASTNLGRFGYTGQAWLPEVNMWHYRARIYSPTLGRFLQTDPIGYGDGMNMYAYVSGDPVNYADPLGLAAERDGIQVCITENWFMGIYDMTGQLIARVAGSEWTEMNCFGTDTFTSFTQSPLDRSLPSTDSSGPDIVVTGRSRFCQILHDNDINRRNDLPYYLNNPSVLSDPEKLNWHRADLERRASINERFSNLSSIQSLIENGVAITGSSAGVGTMGVLLGYSARGATAAGGYAGLGLSIFSGGTGWSASNMRSAIDAIDFRLTNLEAIRSGIC